MTDQAIRNRCGLTNETLRRMLRQAGWQDLDPDNDVPPFYFRKYNGRRAKVENNKIEHDVVLPLKYRS